MADIRINSLPTTASASSSNDFLAIDGATNGTRKLNAFSPTFGGNLTVSGTTGVTATDLTLGTSGPSVKSTLSARAPRQGLVFDGTATTTSTSVPAFGTSDFTLVAWISPTNTGADQVILGGTSGAPGWYVKSNGKLELDRLGFFSGTQSASTVSFGKRNFVVYTRSGSTGTYYFDGVSSGTVTDSQNYGNGVSLIGTDGGVKFTGSIVPLIYNRALSASEVVALYEAGAPASTDYPSKAAGVTINSSAWTNLTYDSLTSANGGTFTAVKASSVGYVTSAPTAPAIKKGTKIRVSGVLTLNNGKTVKPEVYIDEAYATLQLVNVASGASFSYELTAVTNSATNITFQTAGDADYTISNLVITSLGLLLAPDAAQAGGGLVWYDTSGNAANITLPASGVSWNVPSSSKVATGWSYTGALNTTKVGAGSSVLNMGFFAGTTFAVAATDGIGIGDSGAGAYKLIQSYGGAIALNPGGNNVWIGKNSDSANGVLQLATHTTSAGGIGFGTDTSLYRVFDGNLALDHTNGTNPIFYLRESGSGKVYLQSSSGNGTLATLASGKSLFFNTGANTLALTLDSSQNATFAGILTVNGSGTTQIVSNVSIGTGSGKELTVASGGGNGGITFSQDWRARRENAVTGNFIIEESTVAKLTLAATTGDATFAGTVKVNNKGIVKSADNVNIGTSATTIFTLSGTGGASFCFVCGDNGSAGFADLVVTVGNGETVTVISSATIYGSPAARTYTTSGTSLKLAMASGVMNVRTTAIYTA